MPELMADYITSLDGYTAAEGWPGLWGMGGPEYFEWLAESPVPEYLTLMGATTYRLMSGFAEQGEGMEELTAMPKAVFSSTLTEPLSWANTELMTGDPVATVRALKADGGRELRTLGSMTLCRALLRAGLVDRLRVVVFPVINGVTGRERLYDDFPEVMLELVGSRTFDGRLQLLEYLPTVIDGPPVS